MTVRSQVKLRLFHPPERTRFLAALAALVYLLATCIFLAANGSWPTPDFLIPPLLLIAVLMGRGWRFLIDWAPFLLLIFVYEAFRGIADDLNTRVHLQELIAADRWLVGSEQIPTVYLQNKFFQLGSVRWYDWGASILHMAHFAAPVAFGFALWLKDRAIYWRFVASVLVLFLAGFVTYYFYPAAPPWLASDMGLIPHVSRVLVNTLLEFGATEGISLAYQNFSPNPVAAMPSLHAALPALLAAIAVAHYGRRALPVLLYPLAGGLAWIYLGEHYLIDVLIGWLYAMATFLFVWMAGPRVLLGFVSLNALRTRRLAFRPLPSWPLAAVALTFIVFVWANPLIEAPLRPRGGGLVPDANIVVGLAEARTVHDFSPTPCEYGRSPSLLLDSWLEPLAGQWAGYIQGVDSPGCLVITARRSFEPLMARELRLADGSNPIRGAVPLSTDAAVTLVRAGPPSGDLLEVEGINQQERIVVVLLLDNPDSEEPALEIMSQIVRLALSTGE